MLKRCPFWFTNFKVEYPPDAPIEVEHVEVHFERRIGPNDNGDDFPPVVLQLDNVAHTDKERT